MAIFGLVFTDLCYFPPYNIKIPVLGFELVEASMKLPSKCSSDQLAI